MYIICMIYVVALMICTRIEVIILYSLTKTYPTIILREFSKIETKKFFKRQGQYILKHWKKVDLMNVIHKRQISVIIPAKNNKNAK